MSDDRIKAWLDERRMVHAAATKEMHFQHWGGQNQNGDYAESILLDERTGDSLAYGLPDVDGDSIVDAHNHFPAALSAIEAVLGLHRPFRYYDHEDACANIDEDHRNERHVEFDLGEYYCEDLPTGEVVCESCRDEDGEQVDYPCETRRELEGAVGNE